MSSRVRRIEGAVGKCGDGVAVYIVCDTEHQ